MAKDLMLSLGALAALTPGLLAVWHQGQTIAAERIAPDRPGAGWPGPFFWIALALAIAGPSVWLWRGAAGAVPSGWWPAGLAAALWSTVAATGVLFLIVCRLRQEAWRLGVLLMPYLLGVGVLATLALAVPQRQAGAPGGADFWLVLHVAVSLATYGLITLAAVASLAGLLVERALKTKRPSPLSRVLPPLLDCESLAFQLLAAAELVLAIGLMSGMTILHYENGFFWRFDHKSLLSLSAFLLIGLLLALHAATGARGRAIARLLLSAYLLLTLAYPGVKFVRDVLMSAS